MTSPLWRCFIAVDSTQLFHGHDAAVSAHGQRGQSATPETPQGRHHAEVFHSYLASVTDPVVFFVRLAYLLGKWRAAHEIMFTATDPSRPLQGAPVSSPSSSVARQVERTPTPTLRLGLGMKREGGAATTPPSAEMPTASSGQRLLRLRRPETDHSANIPAAESTTVKLKLPDECSQATHTAATPGLQVPKLRLRLAPPDLVPTTPSTSTPAPQVVEVLPQSLLDASFTGSVERRWNLSECLAAYRESIRVQRLMDELLLPMVLSSKTSAASDAGDAVLASRVLSGTGVEDAAGPRRACIARGVAENRELLWVVDEMWRDDSTSVPFQLPVPECVAPRYYSKIKCPVSLASLYTSIHSGAVASFTALKELLAVMKSNCAEYNGFEDPLNRKAQAQFNIGIRAIRVAQSEVKEGTVHRDEELLFATSTLTSQRPRDALFAFPRDAGRTVHEDFIDAVSSRSATVGAQLPPLGCFTPLSVLLHLFPPRELPHYDRTSDVTSAATNETIPAASNVRRRVKALPAAGTAAAALGSGKTPVPGDRKIVFNLKSGRAPGIPHVDGLEKEVAVHDDDDVVFSKMARREKQPVRARTAVSIAGERGPQRKARMGEIQADSAGVMSDATAKPMSMCMKCGARRTPPATGAPPSENWCCEMLGIACDAPKPARSILLGKAGGTSAKAAAILLDDEVENGAMDDEGKPNGMNSPNPKRSWQRARKGQPAKAQLNSPALDSSESSSSSESSESDTTSSESSAPSSSTSLSEALPAPSRGRLTRRKEGVRKTPAASRRRPNARGGLPAAKASNGMVSLASTLTPAKLEQLEDEMSRIERSFIADDPWGVLSRLREMEKEIGIQERRKS